MKSQIFPTVTSDRYTTPLNRVTIEENEPKNVKQALSGPDKDQWKKTMDEIILKENNAWNIEEKIGLSDKVKI